MTAVVRAVTLDDAPALFELWQGLRQHYAATDRRISLIPVSATEFASALRDRSERATACAFIAEDDGEPVGFVTGALEENQPDRLPEIHATIGHLYVLPAYRRQGVARDLLAQVFEWARHQEGVRHAEMSVLAADGEAADFWRAQGFTPYIQRLWAPIDPTDAP